MMQIFFKMGSDGPKSPQDRPNSPGPDLDQESDLQPTAPAGRRRVAAHVWPITFPDIVCNVSGPDPLHVVQDFDQ
jgi:hypothetical protein